MCSQPLQRVTCDKFFSIFLLSDGLNRCLWQIKIFAHFHEKYSENFHKLLLLSLNLSLSSLSNVTYVGTETVTRNCPCNLDRGSNFLVLGHHLNVLKTCLKHSRGDNDLEMIFCSMLQMDYAPPSYVTSLLWFSQDWNFSSGRSQKMYFYPTVENSFLSLGRLSNGLNTDDRTTLS